ncbi:hypothetical protein ACFWY5_49620 [Nonomuraea sp. NPDC059007]
MIAWIVLFYATLTVVGVWATVRLTCPRRQKLPAPPDPSRLPARTS